MMPLIDSLKVDYHPDINIVKINLDASMKLVKVLDLKGVLYLVKYEEKRAGKSWPRFSIV